MNEIEKKALALVNEVAAERDEIPYYDIPRDDFSAAEALCRAIEQNEALQADNVKLREEIIAILNQRIEDILACKAQPLVAKFVAVDEIDWLEETKIAIAAALQETEQ